MRLPFLPCVPAAFVLSTAVLCLTGLHAQTTADALRYSEVFPLGTARSLGTANSMSALGADWSAVAANPAGLAAFRRNEFTITAAGIYSGSDSPQFGVFTGPSGDQDYTGGPSAGADSDFRFAVPQVALVLTRKPIGSRWTQFNFGVGVSQSNRFEDQFGFEGPTAGSITDLWLDEANGYALDDRGRRAFDVQVEGQPADFFFNPFPVGGLPAFGAGLAFGAGVLIPGDNTENPPFYNTDYDLARTDVFRPGAPLLKRGVVSRTGRNAAIDLSFGANYDEKLMLGATLGLSRLRYESALNYQEIDSDDAVPLFERLDFNEFSTITGTGIQVRLGAIYRLSQALRLGLAYHSPSFISIEDDLDVNLRYPFINNEGTRIDQIVRPTDADGNEIDGTIEYDFRSPSQYKASVAGLLGKRGFVSGEVTYLNFGGATFGASNEGTAEDEAAFDAINDGISQQLRSAVQLRIGGEVNLSPVKLRAGFQYIGAPIEDEDAALGLNAGIGFRQNRLGLDLGYQTLIRPDRSYVPYAPGPTNFPLPEVSYTPVSHTFALTLGWKLVSL